MLTHWQEPLFRTVARRLPFIRSQPLSTFSMACILGDGTYILNGKVGSLFDLGLGAIHPGMILTIGGISALIGHIFLLAGADRVDQDDATEQGSISAALRHCRAAAKIVTLGWRPANPFMLGFAALTLNGLALALDGVWELLLFGFVPVAALQCVNGLVVMAGLGAAMLSRVVQRQAWRDALNIFAPKLLAYATMMTLLLGAIAVAPFMMLGGMLFVLGNAAQHHYAMRLQQLEKTA